MYKKGIEVLEIDRDIVKQANNQEQVLMLTKQIASGLASIAELFMTEPLCDEPNAEQECETCLNKALEFDESNIDAIQCLANLRMLRQKDDEALFLLKKVVQIFDLATGDQASTKTKQ